MTALLVWLGRHATEALLAGFLLMPFLPIPAELVRPVLPALVVLVIGLGVARQDLRLPALAQLFDRRTLCRLGLLQLAVQPLAALLAGVVAGLCHWPAAVTLAVLGFLAAPPLSSGPNVALMLGYDFRLSLRLMLLGTMLSPLLVPLSLGLAGVHAGFPVTVLALRVLAVLGGGILLGLALQKIVGTSRIARNPEIFNGISALGMIAFLVPLLAGARQAVAARPGLTLGLLALGLLLNLGGNLAVRALAARRMDGPAARSMGLAFGNRNVSLVLAILPPDPTFTLFVAAAQLPIYATPFLFRLLEPPSPHVLHRRPEP